MSPELAKSLRGSRRMSTLPAGLKPPNANPASNNLNGHHAGEGDAADNVHLTLEALNGMPGMDAGMMNACVKALETNLTNPPDRGTVIGILKHLR